MTAVMCRWLLAVLALVAPAAVQHRSGQPPADAAQETVHLSSAAETVFRHYV